MLKTYFTLNSKTSSFLSSTFLLCLLALPLAGCGGDNTEEFQAEGNKLMEEGNPNGAIVFFKNALEKDASNFSLRYDLAKAYILSGKTSQAIAELDKCLLQQPTNIALLLTTANFYTSIREPEKALGYLAQIEKLQNPTAETRELTATNLRFMERIDEAEQAYKEALQLEPNRVTSEVNLASLYLSKNETAKGLELLNKILTTNSEHPNALQLRAMISESSGAYATAENDYKKLIALHPNEAHLRYSLGSLLIKQNKLDEAKEVHAAMLTSFKSNSYESLLAGLIAFQEKDYEKAATLLQQSAQKMPSVDALYYLASSLHQINNSESALSNLRRILDVQPTNTSALMLTARILLDQGRAQEAEYEAKRLVEISPNNSAAYDLLASIQSALGKYDEALVTLDKSLEINSSNPQAIIERSSILMQQNQEVQAISELEKAVEEHEESVAIRSALFNYHMKNSNYDAAIEVAQEGIEEAPTNALFFSMLASAYMAQQKNNEAITALEKAIALEPTFMPATELLLNIYMLENNYQKALELTEKHLASNPEDTEFMVTSSILLDNLGRTDDATARLEEANALNSERALVSLVRRALNAGDKAKAEKYLTDKLAQYPVAQVRSLLSIFYVEQNEFQKALDVFSTEELQNNPEALVGKFRLYMQASDFANAINEADSFIKNYPDSADGYVLRAFALEQDNKFDDAFKTLDDAYKNLQSSELLIQLANLCLRDKRYDKASSYFRTALLKNPNDIAAISGQGYALLQQGKYADAIASFERILELYPQNLANINNLAMALAKEGINTSRAAELAKQVFLTAPENVDVIDTYAYTLQVNNQVKEAKNIVLNGLKANPNSALLTYRLGLILLAENNTVEALKNLEKAIELGDFSEIENAKKIIKENS